MEVTLVLSLGPKGARLSISFSLFVIDCYKRIIFSLLAGFKMTEASEKADSGVENPSLSMSVASSPAHQQIFSDDYVELEEPDSAILHDDLDNNADYADAQENDSKSDSQNDESKKRRPKILPPENDDNNAKTSEDAERTENNIRNIRLSTLRKRKNFRPNSCGVGPQRKVARSRYLVQVNRPGDENPPRLILQILVFQFSVKFCIHMHFM